MKNLVVFLFISLLFLGSCGLVDSNKSAPADGWFHIEVPLGNQKNSYNIMGLYFLNPNTGWIVGRKTAEKGTRAYVGFTKNGGKNWSFKFIENYTSLRSVYFFNKKEGVTADQVIHYTKDEGNTWTHRKIHQGEPASGVYELAFGSSYTGWGVGPFGAIAKTTDKGKTWNYLDLGYDDEQFVSVSAIGNQYAWALSLNLLLRTTDGGTSWQQINLQNAVQAAPVRYRAITFVDTNQGWATGDYRRILHTTDGGQTWTLQYPKTEAQRNSDAFFGISAYDSLNALAVTGQGAILRTKDGGETWQKQLSIGDEGGGLSKVQFINTTVAYAIGGNQLIKTVTGGEKNVKKP